MSWRTCLLLISSYKPFTLIQVAFFVAFLSWFAFPPLIPDAIKSDLHLTTAQVGNSNIIALSSTLLFRAGVGPMVDRYGPRKVMAWLLILGAIPSGLAGQRPVLLRPEVLHRHSRSDLCSLSGLDLSFLRHESCWHCQRSSCRLG